MRSLSRDARTLAAVVAIRGLQADRARLELARARRAQRAAEERLEEGRTSVRGAEQGWARATASAMLDPNLSSAWAHALAARRREEQELECAATAAGAKTDDRRAELQAAEARRDVASAQAREVARAAARRQEERRLSAIEDQLNVRRRMP